MPVKPGIDRLIREFPEKLRGKNFGLLANQASVTSYLQYSFDALNEAFPGQLAALFTPQHGIWGEQQANMIETGHSRHSRFDIPVYSLYGDVRSPTDEMLSGLDCLIVDLQDVGTRVYTYIWTLSYCLEACSRLGIQVIVLDRPNPIGGRIIEGPWLNSDFRSFVGRYEIPMRHGLTIGEFALWAGESQSQGVALEVIPMSGWDRDMLFMDTGLHWIPPSPNIPSPSTTLLYPGMVLLEGTNLSEGRGTTRPFEVLGAPFIDSGVLAAELTQLELPGVKILPTRFEPTFDKWKNQSCGGAAFYIEDATSLRSYDLAVAVLTIVKRLWPEEFCWLPPPYEYETIKMPIDILSGSDKLRISLDEGATALPGDPVPDASGFLRETVAGSLLY